MKVKGGDLLMGLTRLGTTRRRYERKEIATRTRKTEEVPTIK